MLVMKNLISVLHNVSSYEEDSAGTEWKELPNDKWQGMKNKGRKGEVLLFNQHVNFVFQHSLMLP